MNLVYQIIGGNIETYLEQECRRQILNYVWFIFDLKQVLTKGLADKRKLQIFNESGCAASVFICEHALIVFTKSRDGVRHLLGSHYSPYRSLFLPFITLLSSHQSWYSITMALHSSWLIAIVV